MKEGSAISRTGLPQVGSHPFKLHQPAVVSLIVGLNTVVASANGIYRDGASAVSMSLGGADVAAAGNALDALHLNPAGLGAIQAPTLQLGAVGGIATGDFTNPANTDGSIKDGSGAMPVAAIAYPLSSVPVTFGLGVVPDALLGAEWRYVDTPGGAGGATSYGVQKHRSEILALRTALGASVKLHETFTVGASLGLVYNRNKLQAPYIFQSHPALEGLKTLLDLNTEGYGFNGTFGMLYQPIPEVSIGLAWLTKTSLHSQGDASGNAGVQLQNLGLNTFRPDFHYDAEVGNRLPQTISGGVGWQVSSKWRTILQVDWVDWADAFDSLHIRLSEGNNADLNGLLGSSEIVDIVPLNWKDEFVFRAGAEYQATETIALRMGYAYGANPIPSGTLLPLTAAITEHTLTVGVGWRKGRYSVDFAYQCGLPAEERVGTSDLKGGEYSNSTTSLTSHWLGLTSGISF